MANIDLKFEKMEVLSDLNASLEADSRRTKQIDEEIGDNIHELDKEKMKKEDEMLLLNKVTKERNDLKEKIDKLSTIKLEYNEKIRAFEDKIRNSLNEINVKESRYKFLVETEKEFEGYNRAVKEVLTKCQKDNEFGKNIYGALASLINVPSEYETAIEMVLGASIQNVVTETEDDAKRAIAYLKAGNFGRASFLPISAVKGNKMKENLKGETGFVGIASDLITYDAKYENIILNLLGKTAVATNMDEAVKIAKKYKYGFRIVTLDGDVVNPSGQMSGGSTFKKTTSILSRAREITELEEIIKKLKNNSQKLVDELEEYKKTSTEALEQFDTIEKNMQEVNISFAAETEKMSSIDSNIERMNKKIEILNQEKAKLVEQIEQMKKDVNVIKAIDECLANYEIVDMGGDQFITSKRLSRYNITTEDLRGFSTYVNNFSGDRTFTYKSLRDDGFNRLSELGFDTPFYNSLLIESKLFKYSEMDGVVVFNRRRTPTLGMILEQMMKNRSHCDIYDLRDELESHYGIRKEKSSLLHAINNTSLYYNEDMETVFRSSEDLRRFAYDTA